MIWLNKKQVHSCRKSDIKENIQYKLCTVVFEVLSFVGNPVSEKHQLLFLKRALTINVSKSTHYFCNDDKKIAYDLNKF